MKVSRQDWKRLISKLAAISKKAADDMESYMYAHTVADMAEIVMVANALATKYGEASAALSCDMYDAIAEASGVAVPPAEPAPTATYGEVARAVYGTAKTSPASIPQVVGRLVKTAGADTTLRNAERDGAQFAWVPSGDSCAFCITLASRGWQYMSKKALKNGHAEHIHSNCDCEYAIRFSEKDGVEGYDPQIYEDMYYGAEGNTPQERINAMRREKYAADPEKIRAQKRKAYARRKDTDDEPAQTKYIVRDTTEEWFKNAHKNPPKIVNKEKVEINGKTYKVDGKNVKFAPSDNEKHIANLLTKKLGGEIELWPTITKPEHIQTPDYFYYGKRTDLKTPQKTNTDTLYNACHKKKKQADSFVFDLSYVDMSKEEAIKQAEALFKRKGTKFVKRVILIKDDEIFKILEK